MSILRPPLVLVDLIETVKLRIFIPLFVCLVFGSSGCFTPQFTVSVNSISEGQPVGGETYVIVSGFKNTDSNDLQFKEAARLLETALQDKGMVRLTGQIGTKDAVVGLEKPDTALLLYYEIGRPQVYEESYSVPILGQTGGGSSSFSATTHGSYGNSTTYGSVYRAPTFGVVGSRSGTRIHTTFVKYLSVEAFDLDEYRSSGKSKQKWKTTIVTADSSGDLRQFIPILITAGRPYFGTDTGKFVDTKISEPSRQANDLKGVE
jgi:hypothetical protein